MCNKHITFQKEDLWIDSDNPRGPDNCLIRTYELHTIWGITRIKVDSYVTILRTKSFRVNSVALPTIFQDVLQCQRYSQDISLTVVKCH